MRIILPLLFFISTVASAQQSAPLASCISYEMNRIDKNTGAFVLENVFTAQLFENLKSKFPKVAVDWSAWATSVKEYIGDDGKDKTKLKGCFDISEIHKDSKLVSSIMRISMTRFQAAMKFYSKPKSEHIPQEKVDLMLDGYEELLKTKSVKKAMQEELKNSKSTN